MTNQVMEMFKLTLYSELYQTEKGNLLTYGELARLSGQPNYARQVGRILKNLPKDTQLPWYRVVKGNKEIAFSIGSDAYERQKNHLEKEGWIIRGQKIIRSL